MIRAVRLSGIMKLYSKINIQYDATSTIWCFEDTAAQDAPESSIADLLEERGYQKGFLTTVDASTDPLAGKRTIRYSPAYSARVDSLHMRTVIVGISTVIIACAPFIW